MGIIPITLHVPADQAEFLERFASHRNVLADVQGIKLKVRWSRKSMAESLLGGALNDLMGQLKEQVKECGALPPKASKGDKAARKTEEAYAKKVLAWAKSRP